ncbi:Fur family transcriptional regulator [Streptomyces sp. NPDC057580]|uniref:Fur family transcriptional regulator n=1 Tax=Streptomyces sp. NPDC057580 TaxID=3346173 RepID=UPI0036CDC853
MAKFRAGSAGFAHQDTRRAGTAGKDRAAHEPMALAAARLREAHLRVTAQRMAVLTAIEELSGHPDVEAVRVRAQEVTGGLSLQAAYNVLRVLTEVGLVRCTQIAGHPARYETEQNDNHHHFVCRFCGDIIDVDCVIGKAPCLRADLPEAYHVDEAAVTFWGACPRCTPAGVPAEHH